MLKFRHLCAKTPNILKPLPCLNVVRNYVVRKRFYKRTGILHSGNGKYEVTLDQRKLKTPKGNAFVVDSEPLALAVAAEWDSQKSTIQQSLMHLTALCSTALDNPNHLTKYDIVQYIVNHLDSDTVLFQSSEDDGLYDLQVKEWDPVIKWFSERFCIDLKKNRGLVGWSISEESKDALRRYLLWYNFTAIHGFVYGVDTLKSVILTLACVEKFLTPEKAVLLCRLEEEYQLGHWGRVEWAHDLNQQDLQARLAAVVLFIYFNSTSTMTQTKNTKPFV